MDSDNNIGNQLILEHFKQQDQHHRDLIDKIEKIQNKQLDHEKILLRNTITVENHVKGSIATNKRLEIVEEKLFDMTEDVAKAKMLWDIFKPTKKKVVGVLILLSLLTGGGITLDKYVDQQELQKIIKVFKKNP